MASAYFKISDSDANLPSHKEAIFLSFKEADFFSLKQTNFLSLEQANNRTVVDPNSKTICGSTFIFKTIPCTNEIVATTNIEAFNFPNFIRESLYESINQDVDAADCIEPVRNTIDSCFFRFNSSARLN